MITDYLVRRAEGAVETWSVKRLQFQPSGWQIEWRKELKAALRDLGASSAGFLAGRYESPVCDVACDPENILFYNLSGAFADATRRGLRFERLFSVPPSPLPLSRAAEHYHHYTAAEPRTPFHAWQETRLIAQFAGVELPWIKSNSNPALVWLPVRGAAAQVDKAPLRDPMFALRLRAEVPVQAGSGASLAKPLFDGVVAAFQAHDGSSSADIAAWLSGRFAIDAKVALALLTDRGSAVLGTRCLFNARAGQFQWAPGDDYCVAGELELNRSGQGREFYLSGALYEVEPLQASR